MSKLSDERSRMCGRRWAAARGHVPVDRSGFRCRPSTSSPEANAAACPPSRRFWLLASSGRVDRRVRAAVGRQERDRDPVAGYRPAVRAPAARWVRLELTFESSSSFQNVGGTIKFLPKVRTPSCRFRSAAAAGARATASHVGHIPALSLCLPQQVARHLSQAFIHHHPL